MLSEAPRQRRDCRRWRNAPRRGLGAAFALCLGGGAAQAAAIGVELNRLDDQAGNCRASFVIANPGPEGFSGFKLDLVVFDRGGTIARRLAAETAPLRPAKTTVKMFDIPGMACSGIGSILVNDVLDCRDEAGGAVGDCVGRIAPASKTAVPLTK